MKTGLVGRQRWILPTLLVIVAIGILIRLGLWQLERLQQRRESIAKVLFQMEQPPLNITENGLNDLTSMEYRRAIVEGEFDHENQVVLINQIYQGKYGAHLFTPLRIKNSDQGIMIDRGWIPADQMLSGSWRQYDEPGQVRVEGVIRLSQREPDLGRISDPTPVVGGERLKTWNLANLDQMALQLPYPIMRVYLQASPDPDHVQLPYRTEPEINLTEGSHLSYALQWFTFAAILAIGYPFYVYREEQSLFQKGMIENLGSTDSEGLVS